ncbi:MAG: two-component regulator propeller domain-containing protein, partial [Acidobacteriota bacterium]
IVRGLRGGDGVWRFSRRSELRASSREVVWEIVEDGEGSVWWGTLGGGLHQLVDAPAVTFGHRDGLDGHRPLAVLPSPTGGLDVTTRGGGVLHFDGERFRRLDDDWAAVNAWSLDYDGDGGLWLATTAPSLDHIVEGRLHRRYTHADGLGPGRVLTVHVDRRDAVWTATSSGLARIRDGVVEMWTTADGLVHDSVLTLTSGEDGTLWIGTRHGLSTFDGERFTNLGVDGEHGLRNGSVWAALPRADGSAWVGTFGGGLHRIVDGRTDGVVTVRDGMPSNDITTIVLDETGHLWLATTRGLAWVPEAAVIDYLDGRLSTLPIRVLDSRHGLTSAEFFGGQPIGIQHEGSLWFVHLDGLTRVDPSRLRDRDAPDVVFTRLEVDGVVVEAGPQSLPPGPHTLAFRWAAATLDSPERHRFRYRLDGFEQAWSEPVDDRAIRYTNVGSGDYAFEVQASDDRGRFVDSIRSIRIVVEPRFTETTAFYALVGLALVAVGVGIQQVRVWRLRRRQAELSRVAHEAVAKVRTLRGLLPMCASCKKVRDDAGYWNQIEVFLDTHSEAELSHGLCPECMADSWAELDREVPVP